MANRGDELFPRHDTVVTGTVTAGNTADVAFPDVQCAIVVIQPDSANSGVVYVNAAASGTTTGFRFDATTPPQTFYVDNLSRLGQAYGSAAGQKLRYIAFR